MSELQSTSSAVATPRTRETISKIDSERLSIELDFGRISHQGQSGTTHPHVLFSPMHYEPGYAYPLIVWLHGLGGDERQIMRLMPVLSMRNYVAIAPQGFVQAEPELAGKRPSSCSLDVAEIINGGIRPKPMYDWPQTDEAISNAERRIFDCISIAKQKNNIADNRIFLVGFGSGGTMALRLSLLYPESFAGGVSLCGAFPSGKIPLRQWNAARNLSIMLSVGTKSNEFSPEDACESLELLHTAGMPLTLREYPCGQEIAPAMLQDVNRWIMERVCS